MFISDTARLYRMAAEGANFTNGCGWGRRVSPGKYGCEQKKNNVKERRNKKYKCKRIRWIEENYCVVMLTQGIQILVQSIEVSWVADHEKERGACMLACQ